MLQALAGSRAPGPVFRALSRIGLSRRFAPRPGTARPLVCPPSFRGPHATTDSAPLRVARSTSRRSLARPISLPPLCTAVCRGTRVSCRGLVSSQLCAAVTAYEVLPHDPHSSRALGVPTHRFQAGRPNSPARTRPLHGLYQRSRALVFSGRRDRPGDPYTRDRALVDPAEGACLRVRVRDPLCGWGSGAFVSRTSLPPHPRSPRLQRGRRVCKSWNLGSSTQRHPAPPLRALPVTESGRSSAPEKDSTPAAQASGFSVRFRPS